MNIRTLIKKDNNVLLCYVKNQEFYFLPGGGLEDNETCKDCICIESLRKKLEWKKSI